MRMRFSVHASLRTLESQAAGAPDPLLPNSGCATICQVSTQEEPGLPKLGFFLFGLNRETLRPAKHQVPGGALEKKSRSPSIL